MNKEMLQFVLYNIFPVYFQFNHCCHEKIIREKEYVPKLFEVILFYCFFCALILFLQQILTMILTCYATRNNFGNIDCRSTVIIRVISTLFEPL